ncbi:glycosyl hydrolase [Leptobacterium flavescens]|uniref:Glycosyl hydrolase n=1 Tax=Leptobacterium flavescens TaxID=472055 RepID=A0A6P0UII8_9FLAO|nr:glycosyl hydrolase [Leptobacterium flavescens]NER13171.1 glycosyl hydrolase [Leptobacterium flavescens]
MKKYLLPVLAVSSFALVHAQPKASSTEDLQQGLQEKNRMHETSLVKNIPFENIGPTVMSGRIVDVDVNPANSTEFYVAYASGGVWYTNNNGTSYVPVMDNTETQNVGDIAVDWKNGTIWIGTGENNSSRSSYAGIGILKSTDRGKTWQNVGLPDSHHIGRILINPNNPDEVVIGVTGHLYSPNESRGIYKTTDGGKTWQKTLFINNETGIIDVVATPGNFNVMYAAAWEKDRKAWNFLGNGDDSGIYKSTDGGDNWTLITTKGSGFPTGEGVGRIGLIVFDENTLYAVHDNQFHRKSTTKKSTSDALTKEDFKSMSTQDFLNLDNKKLNNYLKNNGFQEKYRADNVKQMVRSGSVKPVDLARYLENANALLFDTPVIGAEVYRSDDAGKSWKKTHKDYIDGLFFSYGYYFAQIAVDPNDKNKIYLAGVPLIKSDDGGKTFSSISKENVHADHHSIWVDPKMPGHIINGNDGGINITYDDGETWIKSNSTSVGQFYAIAVDNEKPYNVYGGLQDNGVWKGPNNASENRRWHQSGHYPWESIMGGDGMQVQVDNRNSNIVYTGFQFGNYFRLDLEKDSRAYIQPKHELGESPYRFNWQTPILLSPHNQDILYLGGNKLHRSMNQGRDWDAISGDLTTGGKKGNVAYGTLTTISESPFQFGLIYVGSDDGLVNVSKNGGGSWEQISGSFPKDMWVSRVIASSHKKERVYVTLNGYRWDDFTPYVYSSDDYGKSWKNISANLPLSSVNVIREDPENENVLYVGTDNGVYVSFDRGGKWEVFTNGLPNVAVHDLVIQEEAKDLLIGTHGRSIYKTNIAPIQQLTADDRNKAVHLFNTDPIRHSQRWGRSFGSWGTAFEPSITFRTYVKNAGNYTANILAKDGTVLQSIRLNADKGFNYISYDLTISEKGKKAYTKKNKNVSISKSQNGKYYLPKGKYQLEISGNGVSEKGSFELK